MATLNFYKIVVACILLDVTMLIGFEVNTHQALTRCAVTNNCGNGTTKNLDDFISHGELKSESYNLQDIAKLMLNMLIVG